MVTYHPHKGLTADELEEMPTLSEGYTANLKIDEDGYRVWLERTEVDKITVEQLQDGKWVTIDEYEGRP